MERQPTLLLVEDEHVLRKLVAQFLRGEGYRVIEACDGHEAVEQYFLHSPLDLVIVDLNLPGLPGTEVCARIKGIRPAQPILVCSASILPDYERVLGSVGVKEYLRKPFHPQTLLDRIVEMTGVVASLDPQDSASAPLRRLA
jgi:DNA-binding response OmpR family regulator